MPHSKKKTPKSKDFGVWQRMKDSNPHIQSQSLLCYHYTNPLYFVLVLLLFGAANKCYYSEILDNVNGFLKNFLNIFLLHTNVQKTAVFSL